ncbi:MAG TPA: glycoside hydrolase family 16 protein [Chitinivibrionales bacterium]|nr:glycoside hydrolase family 16 protein [Chitinivibrionales bacterium]
MAISRFAAFIFMLPLSLCAQGWKLVWADSFDTYSGLPDSTKWSYQVGAGGWGNNEAEYYTANRPENCRVENGTLIIEARQDFWQNNEYTSARIRTMNKGDWLYGRFEVRAKLPYGGGTWPAIWMMPTDNAYGGWPQSGEIDIMEHVGNDPSVIHFSAHSLTYNWRAGTAKTDTTRADDFATAFHVYAMEWTPDTIRGYLDTLCYFTYVNEHSGWESWPFDRRFYFILNIALGGDWGGAIDNNIFPQQMVIDYVKVYQWSNGASARDKKTAAPRPGYSVQRLTHSLMVTMPSPDRRTASLYGLDGRVSVVANCTGNFCTLPLCSLAKGTYLLRISGVKDVFQTRIIWDR